MKIANGYHRVANIIFMLSFFFAVNCVGLLAQPPESDLPKISKAVLNLIKLADFNRLNKYVHEYRGLQFSPYDDVYDGGPDVTTFSKKDINSFMTSNTKYNWGVYNGSGLDIKLTPKQYYNEFIYDIDFEEKADVVFIGDMESKAPESINIDLAYIFKAYPNSTIVHYYYRGSAENEFCDFKKLTLIFEKIEEKWFLIGIMHGEKGG